jgi:F-type H+-transporting ATPase subunit epsilon
MISSLGKGKMKVIKDKSQGNTETYEITAGFVEVLNNNVSVLIEDATALD